MKVAFDAQLLMKGEKTGIAWCAENILQRMPKYKHDLQLNCFTLGYNEEKYNQVVKYSELDYSIDRCRWFHDALYRIILNFIPLPYRMFFKGKPDVTVFFNFIIPPGIKGKKVAFVHDMAYKAFPETVRKRTRDMLNIALKGSCKRADKIITISEFSKREIIHYLGIEKEKIVVMPCGVDFSLYHNDYTMEAIQLAKRKYGIEGEYILYLGTLEPRKNISRLIQAYSMLKNTTSELPKLVLAGKKGWLYDSIFQMVKDLHMENDVIFTGYIDTKDSPLLMKGAEIFLFPSLYEGFGMPPLEAMACGTPVLVSSVASLPEVIEDVGIFVDPYSVESIRDGMLRLLNDTDIRNKLIHKGLERVKKFSWDESTRIVNDVIQSLK